MIPYGHRLRFEEWMVQLGLEAETADATPGTMSPGTMSPFDWHELATKDDLEPFATKAELERLATKADLADLRSDMDGNFSDVPAEMGQLRREVKGEMAGIRSDVHTVTLALVGFILTVLVAGAVTAVGLA